MRVARELDPMSPVLNTLEAAYLLEAGRDGEARPPAEPRPGYRLGFWLAHCTLGLLHFADRQPAEGIAELRRAAQLADGNSRPGALLAVDLARLGQTEEARTILAQLLALARIHYVSPSSLAAVYAALGEMRRALDALDKAYLSHDTRLTFLKDDPRLDSLRQEPRFLALIRTLGLDRFGPGLAPL